MLCFVDGRLGVDRKSPAYAAVFADGCDFLLLPAPSPVSGEWLWSKGQEPTALRPWLDSLRQQDGLLLRPRRNDVLLVWQDLDSRLAEFVTFLARQQEDLLFVVSLVLAGPLRPDTALSVSSVGVSDDSADNQRVHLHRVWYLGNQDTRGRDVREAERCQVVSVLLRLLASGRSEPATALGLFPPVGAPLENYHTPNVFVALGLRSWEPVAEVIDASHVRQIAGLILDKHLQADERTAADTARACASEAGSMFEKLRMLDVPYAGDGQGVPRHLPDQFAPVPDPSFRRWPCPLLRENATEAGAAEVARNSRAAMAYYDALCGQLPGLASEIRKRGQQVFRDVQDHTRKFISQSPSMVRTATLLRVYFPGFSSRELRPELQPCQPASAPGRDTCERWFHQGPGQVLRKRCQRLPTRRHAAIMSAVTAVLALIAWHLFRSPHDLSTRLTPLVAAALVVGAFFGWALYWAHRIRRELHAHYTARYEELRSAFRTKLEWVVGKTQLTLERQATGDILAMGHRLRANFESFFAGREHAVPADTSIALAGLMARFRLSPDTAERLRESLERAAEKLVADAAQKSLPITASMVPDDLLNQIVAELNQSVPPPVVDHARLREELVALSGDRFEPVLLARLAESDLSGSQYARAFFLPGGCLPCQQEINSHSQQTGVPTRFCGCHLSSPVVLGLRFGLSEEVVRRSLRVTEIR